MYQGNAIVEPSIATAAPLFQGHTYRSSHISISRHLSMHRRQNKVYLGSFYTNTFVWWQKVRRDVKTSIILTL